MHVIVTVGKRITSAAIMFRAFLLGLFLSAHTSIACPDSSELEQNDFPFSTFANGDWFVAGQQAHPFVNPLGTCRKGSMRVDKDDDECMVMLNTQELFGSLAAEGLPDMLGSSLCACANSDEKLKSGRFTWGAQRALNTVLSIHDTCICVLYINQVSALH